MIGAGHMADMNNRIKQNRALRRSNRPKFKASTGIYAHTKHSPDKHARISDNKPIRFKHYTANTGKIHRGKALVVLGIVVVVMVIILFFI